MFPLRDSVRCAQQMQHSVWIPYLTPWERHHAVLLPSSWRSPPDQADSAGRTVASAEGTTGSLGSGPDAHSPAPPGENPLLKARHRYRFMFPNRLVAVPPDHDEISGTSNRGFRPVRVRSIVWKHVRRIPEHLHRRWRRDRLLPHWRQRSTAPAAARLSSDERDVA